MGCPQQVTAPLPARVTISSVPHLAHRYLFPISLAMFAPPFRLRLLELL